MLTKSRKSAFVMASICVFTTIITFMVVLVIRDPATGQMEISQIASGTDNIIGTSAGLLGLLILISFVAILFIYPCDDSHFGCWGAVRWGIVGVSHVLLWEIVLLFIRFLNLPTPPRILMDFVHFLVVWLSYWLVFQLLSSAIKKSSA